MGDDTALNSVRLYCQSPATLAAAGSITSTEQCWGDWRGEDSMTRPIDLPFDTCLFFHVHEHSDYLLSLWCIFACNFEVFIDMFLQYFSVFLPN